MSEGDADSVTLTVPERESVGLPLGDCVSVAHWLPVGLSVPVPLGLKLPVGEGEGLPLGVCVAHCEGDGLTLGLGLGLMLTVFVKEAVSVSGKT